MIIRKSKVVGKYRYIVNLSYKSLSDQPPYFSMDIYRNHPRMDKLEIGEKLDRHLIACGCQHDEVKKHFPELTKYIKWHLVSAKEPMHYIANSMYWWDEGDMDNFNSTAIILPEDDISLWDNREKVKKHLKDRLPALMDLFHETMKEIFGEIY